jgi:hypothetical protein
VKRKYKVDPNKDKRESYYRTLVCEFLRSHYPTAEEECYIKAVERYPFRRRKRPADAKVSG